jgi:2-C-methyl-D-erythritol 4-phosphate cytidylyltransferase/2-C-methyl-D-erythritol 2,4-cyclodiphosphate synthase
VPLEDTLKRATLGVIDQTVPRAGLWRAQTPQVFRREWLEQAHATAVGVATDDAALLEARGRRVRVTPGDAMNFKITWPGDSALAEALLRARDEEAEWSSASVSATTSSRGRGPAARARRRALRVPMGARGPQRRGRAAPRDGRRAARGRGLGDSGTHFPPGDPAWKDASSLELLRGSARCSTRAARAS